MIAHWLSNLLAFVFWIAFGLTALEKYVGVIERSADFGILHVLGASNTYILALLVQETVVSSIPGALLGLGLGYLLKALFQILSRGYISIPILYLWWPAIAAFAASASLVGAISATPKAIREGVAQVL
jgi:ABC-type antimicrobial peptide transport system permease subunit